VNSERRPDSRNSPHVGICIRTPNRIGGVFQSTVALIDALGKLDDGSERYTLVVQSGEIADEIERHLASNQRVVVHEFGDRGADSSNDGGVTAARVLKAVLGPLLPAARYLQNLVSPPRHWPEIPISDGFVERLGCDVVHFPSVWFMLCNLPSVYNPHDLQHLLYPQYFTQGDLVLREVLMPAGCRFANTVVVGTQWVKDDVVRRYHTDPEKIQIIPWASVTAFFPEPSAQDLAAVSVKYQLETPFALYPATCFPYKNHLRLLEALARLRDTQGLLIRLVCTGGLVDWFWPRIEARIHELKLTSQVKFLGFVPDPDLRALYRLSQCLVMPTLYEADSNPIHEAWLEGVPVASSNVTALPDQVRDAGLLFDPWDVGAIADVLARLATDGTLREDLRQRGRRRAQDFDWERTAKAYRAVYRRAADCPLTEEDRWLLQWDWLREPNRTASSDAVHASR
jgi:glycosyltransferase involved in cell wall biosynthesis